MQSYCKAFIRIFHLVFQVVLFLQLLPEVKSISHSLLQNKTIPGSIGFGSASNLAPSLPMQVEEASTEVVKSASNASASNLAPPAQDADASTEQLDKTTVSNTLPASVDITLTSTTTSSPIQNNSISKALLPTEDRSNASQQLVNTQAFSIISTKIKVNKSNFNAESPILILNKSTSLLTLKNQRRGKYALQLNSSLTDLTQNVIVVPEENYMFFKFCNENDFVSFYVLKIKEPHAKVQPYWIFRGFLWNATLDNTSRTKTIQVGDITKGFNFGIWETPYFPPYTGNEYDEDEFADYDWSKKKPVDTLRKLSQENRWKANNRFRRIEPKYAEKINPTYEIYTHVRWYGKEYKENTKIELDEKQEKTKIYVNHFKGFFYGNCKAKTVKHEKLLASNTTRNIVEFYTILLRESCNPQAKKSYLALFDKGYLLLNKTAVNTVYIDLVKDSNLLKKRSLRISEVEELQRLFLLYGYSQVYQSLISFPTDTISPTGKQITHRVFILINTIIHIQETVLEVASDHHEVVILYWIQRLKPILLQIWCEFLTHTKTSDRGTISRLKHDTISISILMEYLLISLQKQPGLRPEDAHQTFEKLYTTVIDNSNKNETYLDVYKSKAKELKNDNLYKERCLKWMYPDMLR